MVFKVRLSHSTPSSTPTVKGLQSVWQLISWVVAGLFAALATFLSLHQIYQHRQRFSKPKEQRKIIAILWIVPIYAINSWLSLRYVHASVYIDAIRDIYEAYVLHMFLSLMFTYLCSQSNNESNNRNEKNEKDMNQVIDELDEDHKIIHHLFPFSCILSPWSVDRSFLQICYRGTLQFCFFKPITTILACIMEVYGLYNEGSFSLKSGYIYISIIMNMSITWAAYVLVLFYLAFKKQLYPYGPVPKFLCIKAILFLSFWQSVVLAGFAQFQFIHNFGEYTTSDVKTGINNMLLCIEMVLIAIAHRYAFPYNQYHHPTATTSNNNNGGGGHLGRSLLNNHFAVGDVLRDVNESGFNVVLPTGFVPTTREVRQGERGVFEKEEREEKEETTVGTSSTCSAEGKGVNDDDDDGWRL